ncbi:hypothetical protein [Pseudarthrobacter sp. J47]|uniref:hypothetical protein n=1 Tax=Pseudarthrobacter sp. J47 TaxID=3116482 RepID=UPI002E824279|nr:hypothetical protein [Pseudarthrobacter sp. J47]MEE2524529.1 hypothetical protein [Pseudarthrobacter sp. J47]
MTSTASGNLVKAIEKAWAAIQAAHNDVPHVVVTIGAGSGTGAGLTLGHFAPFRWVQGEAEVHELFVGGEGLKRGGRDIMGTLLHEAAHGAAQARGIKDTSRQGRYHNKRFKSIGEEFGLVIEDAGSIGWSATTVPDKTASKYARAIAAIDASLSVYRKSEGRAMDGGRTNNNNGITAVCGCGRKIRLSPSTYEMGEIICGICGVEFTTEDD